MPREHRKRGKKNKKKQEENEYVNHEETPQEDYTEPVAHDGPSWIQPAQHDDTEANAEAPFGYVDTDVKAYFRTVDIQIRDWAEAQSEEPSQEQDADPNEERRMFFVAALKEMEGKELQLATDPDCSVILERMAHSMDDFVRRVFMDRLAGSYEQLVRHRFASHVCQTFFTLAQETVARETRGVFPVVPNASQGELRTLTQLILDASEELLPSFSSLLVDPFASHVIRALLLLHAPNLASADNKSSQALRSKKSASWKAKQGKMQSVFLDKGKGKENATLAIPPEFRENALKFVKTLREGQGANEVRALAASQVASPALQILLEVEANLGLAAEKESLMDRVTAGLVTACIDNPEATVEPSDYINTLLRDPTSSHLLETIVSRIPDFASDTLWAAYFKGRLPRLSVHPVANFVLAKAVDRLSAPALSEACTELGDFWAKIITSSRSGVLRAFIERAASLTACETEVCEAIYLAFDLDSSEDRSLLIPCVLCLAPREEYKKRSQKQEKKSEVHQGRHDKTTPKELEPTVQGALLLQSLLKLSAPHNEIVTSNIAALPIEKRIEVAYSANGSRVYDALLDSTSVPPKVKRQFVLDLIGHYHTLVDDRLGSRVGDRCWAFADTYLKEKIARSLFNQEQFLAASFYGKFFARHLNLHLLKRSPDQWRDLQTQRKAQAQAQAQSQPSKESNNEAQQPAVSETKSSKRKRKQTGDEIDALFDASLGKKIKRAALDAPGTNANLEADSSDLKNVFDAIRVAPSSDAKPRKKKQK